MTFAALNLTESGSPIIDLEFAKSNQEKFTLHSLGSPMIMEGLMEESPISRDVCFLKGSPIANPSCQNKGYTGLPNPVQVSLGKGNSHNSICVGRSAQKGHQSA